MQTNSLAVFLYRLPEILKEHSTKVLLVIALILLAIAAYRYRVTAEANRQMSITQNLMGARSLVDELAMRPPGSMPEDQQKALPDRINQARGWLAEALEESATGDKLRGASAQLTLGDLYAYASNFQSGADQKKYLEQAEENYNKVFSQFKDFKMVVRDAHLGLATVNSIRGDFKAAAEQYNAIKNSDEFTPGDKMLAEQGLSRLKDIEHPLVLLPATQPVEPTTKPTTQTALEPVGPIGPVAPTTAPTTQP